MNNDPNVPSDELSEKALPKTKILKVTYTEVYVTSPNKAKGLIFGREEDEDESEHDPGEEDREGDEERQEGGD